LNDSSEPVNPFCRIPRSYQALHWRIFTGILLQPIADDIDQFGRGHIQVSATYRHPSRFPGDKAFLDQLENQI
jgi:hypothetical protein